MNILKLSAILAATVFTQTSHATDYLVAKCDVKGCTDAADGEICGLMEKQFSYLEIYQYSGIDETRKNEGLVGFNAYLNSELGWKALNRAQVIMVDDAIVAIEPEGANVGWSKVSIPRGNFTNATVEITPIEQGNAAKFELLCKTI